jgi:predicted O-linked N-acetylglucosamine transferase (SPINDLY family)
MANVDHVVRAAQGHAEAGRYAQAKSVLQRALAGSPGQADLNNAMANVLLYAGEIGRAAYYAACAVRSRPDRGIMHATLGNALAATGDAPGAEGAYRRAIELDPLNAPAFLGLTNALEAQLRYEDALDVARAGMEATPGDAAMAATCSAMMVNAGRAAEAVDLGRRLMERFAPGPAAMLMLSQAQCFAFNYVSDADPEEVLAEHRRYGALLARTVGGAPAGPPGRGGSDARGRLRVGFLSGDFRSHSVAYFAEPIVEHLERGLFEVFCYFSGARKDATTERIKAKSDHWREATRLDDAALAARIAQDGLDLLVELAGHTLGHRLGVMARKPARIQATAIGYPNTTGVAAIDYRVVDAVTDPPGAEALAVERLARVPECFLCYRPADNAPEVGPLPAASAGFVTFGSFNALPKISPRCVELWVGAVEAVRGPRLQLKNKQLADPRARERWMGLFERAGLGPERLELVGYSPTAAEHMALYGRVDIALDSYPYHGTTTTCEALWMGVPTVTLRGSVHAARVGASLMGTVGLGECVAGSADEFVGIARGLASDTSRLAALRAGMRARLRASALCDGRGYAARVGRVYSEACAQAVGQRPADGAKTS